MIRCTEQPGIVSVVTGTQIKDSGARDLSDVLMQVPGFALDTDVESMIGLTFRGLQGQEGTSTKTSLGATLFPDLHLRRRLGGGM